MSEVSGMTLNDNTVLPSSVHDINQDLLFVEVPCTLRSPSQSIDLEVGGSLAKGADWAALRAPGYAMVSASSLEVISGNVLWHIQNGVTIEGGYQRLEKQKECNPWLYAAAGAVAGFVATKASSTDTVEGRGFGRDRADYTNLSKGFKVFGE